MKHLASLLILTSLSASAQRPDLDGHHFDITYNGSHYDGKISRGLGVAILDAELGVSFENTLVVHVWLTNYQQSPIVMDITCFFVGDSEGNVFEPDHNFDRVLASNLSLHHLNPYESTDGYLYFKMPADRKGLFLIYRAGISNSRFGGIEIK